MAAYFQKDWVCYNPMLAEIEGQSAGHHRHKNVVVYLRRQQGLLTKISCLFLSYSLSFTRRGDINVYHQCALSLFNVVLLRIFFNVYVIASYDLIKDVKCSRTYKRNHFILYK